MEEEEEKEGGEEGRAEPSRRSRSEPLRTVDAGGFLLTGCVCLRVQAGVNLLVQI